MWMFGSRTTVKKVRNSLTWFSQFWAVLLFTDDADFLLFGFEWHQFGARKLHFVMFCSIVLEAKVLETFSMEMIFS